MIDKLEKSSRLPDICILDIGMPGMDGYKTIKVLSKKWPTIRVLVFSQFCQKYAICTMIKMGAKGFISKEENIDILADALINIKEMGYYYSPKATKEMFSESGKGLFIIPDFTPVEKEILSLMCRDLGYNEIAQKLYKSIHTIEKHKQNISKKIGIYSREGLILFAIKNELVNITDNEA